MSKHPPKVHMLFHGISYKEADTDPSVNLLANFIASARSVVHTHSAPTCEAAVYTSLNNVQNVRCVSQ